MTVAIIEAPPESKIGYEGFGAARELWRYQGPEVILEGPYQTGKTIACLQKLNALLAKYPKARALMVRRTYASLVHSAVVTYEYKVLPYPPSHPKCAVRKIGGVHPEEYHYPNGSKIILGGLDNPDKFLSAEFDYIYVNQAEELRLDDYEKLVGRATGRAGNAPYPQVMADCNPDAPTHWILNRQRLKRFKSRHEDNPTLFDPDTGQLTPLGASSMEALDALTGVRYKRGRLGLWVGVEGMVYEEWNRDVHLVSAAQLRQWGVLAKDSDALNRQVVKRVFCSLDWGYTNPGVLLVWAVDGDGRMYLVYQIFRTGRTIDWWKQRAKEVQERYRPECFVCDPSEPAYIAQFNEAGLTAKQAHNEVGLGIQKVQERLRMAKDGRARLYILDSSLAEPDPALRAKFKPACVEEEFPSYAWTEAKDGKPIKEEPVKVDDHGMDGVRYGVMYLDGNRQKVETGSVSLRSW